MSIQKSALIVFGGWEGHEPQKAASFYAEQRLQHGYTVELSDTLDAYLDAERLAALSLTVPVWTMGTITREQEQGLLHAARGRVGIAGWHGTMGDSSGSAAGGEGRVFDCSLGHVLADFDVLKAWTIVTRGMLWASR